MFGDTNVDTVFFVHVDEIPLNGCFDTHVDLFHYCEYELRRFIIIARGAGSTEGPVVIRSLHDCDWLAV